jgi:dienelactone hydrolase
VGQPTVGSNPTPSASPVRSGVTIEDFARGSFTHDGKERAVFRLGTGPAVIVMAEIPGITPKVVEFAERVAGIGCTAVMPHLFGVPGKDPNEGGRLGMLGALTTVMIPACINREFTVLATGQTSPVIDWLRALAIDEHERCGGPGVGAVGMCFTGGFALAMSTIPTVVAPVLSQPSLPLPISKSRGCTIDISTADLATVKERDDLTVVGLRYKSDRFVPEARFQFLRDQLGDKFIAVELEDDDANPAAKMAPHSVLTEHLIDEPGTRSHDALQLVLEHFRSKLLIEA